MEIYLQHCLVGAIVKQMCQAAVLLLFPVDIEGFFKYISFKNGAKRYYPPGTNISHLGRRNIQGISSSNIQVPYCSLEGQNMQKPTPSVIAHSPPQLGRDTSGRNPKHLTFMKPCKLRDIYIYLPYQLVSLPDFWTINSTFFAETLVSAKLKPRLSCRLCAWIIEGLLECPSARFFWGCFEKGSFGPWDVKLEKTTWYCWWTKSCTTKDDEYPIIYKVLYIPGGAGFLSSTVPGNSAGDLFGMVKWPELKGGCWWPEKPGGKKVTLHWITW